MNDSSMDYFDNNSNNINNKDQGPENNAVNNELKIILEKAVDNLPDKYRTVFVMREIEGMSVSETSTCLNLTESNVKVRLNRAKETLRKNISKFYKKEEVFSFKLHKCDKIVSYVLNHINGI